MAIPIALPVVPAPVIAPIRPVANAGISAGNAGVFQEVFAQSIATVEANRAAAAQSVDRFLSGEGEDLHKVALATQKADLSFEMFLQVKNKVVSAYQEIMRMQI